MICNSLATTKINQVTIAFWPKRMISLFSLREISRDYHTLTSLLKGLKQYHTERWIEHESMWQAHNQTDMELNKKEK